MSLENSGKNNGVIVGENHGEITIVHTTKQSKFSSLIPLVVQELAELVNIPDEEMERIYKIDSIELVSYNIPQKIEYNRVIEYRDFINDYSVYGSICDEAFNIIDNNHPGIKRKILNSISMLYKKYKGQLLRKNYKEGINELDIIKDNSDEIIDQVKEELKSRIFEDVNGDGIVIEDIEESLIRILCYAFVECKILEKPVGE
ncbi:hypothetical protein [Paenibacillus xylanexedens]|uniref:hypothetical protein n=1 Tax=Paenibacillus xylanexedens TaxID=528191 RepID=UPI001C8CF915|nr:hypothetical protein [Paenibacillus xylanexedens]MBY0118354.1 portal protein [Paenibacillus xylanexedens]